MDDTAASSSGPTQRTRSLVVSIFGSPRDLGVLPTTLHSDVRSTVLGLTRLANGRGKPVLLPEARASAVDVALRAGGQFPGGTLQLKESIVAWRTALRANCDAEGINRYYDAWRAEGYTAALAGAQEVLTLRCAELGGMHVSERDARPRLVLDLGCGSGLSILPLEQRLPHSRVLGLDLSIEMLKTAQRAGAELLVQADLSKPLPLRPGICDALVSVSAVQFLCEPAGGATPEQRLCTLFAEIPRLLTPSTPTPHSATSSSLEGHRHGVTSPPSSRPPHPSCGIQFHPTDLDDHPLLIARTAQHAMGAQCACAVFVDRPHRTSAQRWFLYASPHSATSPPTSSEPSKSVGPPPCAMHGPAARCACLLSLRSWTLRRNLSVPPADPAYLSWLEEEHARYVHRAMRTLRRIEQAESEAAAAAVVTGSGGRAQQTREHGGRGVVGGVVGVDWVDSGGGGTLGSREAMGPREVSGPSGEVSGPSGEVSGSSAQGGEATEATTTREVAAAGVSHQGRKRKAKGFLAPGNGPNARGGGAGWTEAAMSEEERCIVRRIRNRMAVAIHGESQGPAPAPQPPVPPLTALLEPSVLQILVDAMHGEEES